MATLRHEFYETDEILTLSIFDRGADATQVKVQFAARKFSYTNGDKELLLEPLKGQINPAASTYTVGKVKVEIRFAKAVPGRWGGIVGDSPDLLANPAVSSSTTTTRRVERKNWDGITTDILGNDKDKTSDEDPNVGGDNAVNEVFRKIYKDADEDTRRAMVKSFQESGGTKLSTSWKDVGSKYQHPSPPKGSYAASYDGKPVVQDTDD